MEHFAKKPVFSRVLPVPFPVPLFFKKWNTEKSGTSQRRKDRAQQLADVMLEVQQGERE
jgi:hypothetical protein